MTNQRFYKVERLCKKGWIRLLFAHGKRKYFPGVRLTYFPTPDASSPQHQALFAVPKRLVDKAVARHLLQRRMREAYRLHKHCLPVPGTTPLPYSLAYTYTYRGKIASYHTLAASIQASLIYLAAKMGYQSSHG